jgi:hypothetical protein
MSLVAITLVVFSQLTLTAAPATTAKIFTDKGNTYFRTDPKLISVGAEFDMVTNPKQPEKSVGKAVVMEINGPLARISIDDDAKKAGAKFIVIFRPGDEAQAAAATVSPEKRDEAVAKKADPAVPPAKKLTGRLEVAGLRFVWNNDSDESWTQCKLVHCDGSSFDVGEVVKQTEDGVMRVKLSGAPEPVYDHVEVICSEGQAKFYFDKPSQPEGTLKGYAENDSGSVTIHNKAETAWTACDVRKPDGTHYVLGTLKGHAEDGIAKRRFKKEDASRKPGWIEMRCKQGELRTAL